MVTWPTLASRVQSKCLVLAWVLCIPLLWSGVGTIAHLKRRTSGFYLLCACFVECDSGVLAYRFSPPVISLPMVVGPVPLFAVPSIRLANYFVSPGPVPVPLIRVGPVVTTLLIVVLTVLRLAIRPTLCVAVTVVGLLFLA